ncbi:MAG TPA: cytochrome c [Terriglobia bacterium]|nr:cytochrome c [Terriglobia bacterium]
MKTLLIILAMFAAPQTPSGNPPKGNAENGKALFMKFGCYECHGREGQGAVTGPRLNQNPITFARFSSYIRKPSGEMPPYTAKVVSDPQAADLYAYLQSLPKPPAVESIPLLR